ncbi:MAG: hypothetical protein R3266_14260 [Gemmatimonadota bacterium]|nr:hypothetical protein [Gemmatimonadota bacterium]
MHDGNDLALPRAMRARGLASPLFLLLIGCDPGYVLEGTVQLAPPVDTPLVVQVVPFSTLDEAGLPEVEPEHVRRGLALAAMAPEGLVAFRFEGFGCPDRVRVVAWVDDDGSSAFTASDFDADGLANENDGTTNVPRFVEARPSDGDRVVVSAPIHDPDCARAHEPYTIDLSLDAP